MAPTEVLAWQHHLSISAALADLPVNVVLLTGSQGVAQRRKAMEQIAAGEAHVVGTHALIQKGVDFDDLSLVVVDEQHRFGVGQRTVFREKGTTPDTLVMTATPIPRTLSLTLYGDLEVSLIDELPPGRKPVETRVVDPAERLGAYEEVRKEIEEGRQAYVICPLVEESGAGRRARRRGALRGACERNLPREGGRTLARQDEGPGQARGDGPVPGGEIEVLVATVVVEVGVDVPNASAIVIEGAERFGLSQLHQLRGRVCRGLHPRSVSSWEHPNPKIPNDVSEALERYQDGFKLSEVDLAIRGRAPSSVVARAACLTSRSPSSCATSTCSSRPGARRSRWSGDPTLKRPDHRPLRREIRELLGADVEWLFRE